MEVLADLKCIDAYYGWQQFLSLSFLKKPLVRENVENIEYYRML